MALASLPPHHPQHHHHHSPLPSDAIIPNTFNDDGVFLGESGAFWDRFSSRDGSQIRLGGSGRERARWTGV